MTLAIDVEGNGHSTYGLQMTQLNVTLPPNLEAWVARRIAQGDYVDGDDYVRDLLRRDLHHADDDRRWLQSMIDEGLASGIVDAEPEDVLEEIIAERRVARG